MCPEGGDGDVERYAGRRAGDGYVGRIVTSAAMYLERIAGIGGGPYGRGVREIGALAEDATFKRPAAASVWVQQHGIDWEQ